MEQDIRERGSMNFVKNMAYQKNTTAVWGCLPEWPMFWGLNLQW